MATAAKTTTLVGQPTLQHTTVTVDTANATFSFAGSAATKDGRERRNSADKPSGQKQGTLFFELSGSRTREILSDHERRGYQPGRNSQDKPRYRTALNLPGGPGHKRQRVARFTAHRILRPTEPYAPGGSPHTLLSALARAQYVLLA